MLAEIAGARETSSSAPPSRSSLTNSLNSSLHCYDEGAREEGKKEGYTGVLSKRLGREATNERAAPELACLSRRRGMGDRSTVRGVGGVLQRSQRSGRRSACV